MTDEVLAPLRARYGNPVDLEWTGEITAREHGLATYNPNRTHDVTLFILDPDDRIALIRKPHFAAGIWRPPGGGIPAGRGLRPRRGARSARRDRPRGQARALSGGNAAPRSSTRGESVAWSTHVFLARTRDTVLAPRDAEEIAGARWGTLAELAGPLRERLLETGHALWRYRVALHDAALEALRRQPGV